MRRIALLLTGSLATFFTASSQTNALFNTSETIDISNIKAAHLVHGDMWWDPATATARCEFPKGSGNNLAFVSSLWMGGYDASNSLKVAAQMFRQTGTDYWPGPIDTGALTTVSYATSQKWAKIWKINRAQLDSFTNITAHTVANTPAPILEWPAKGNPYAKGTAGVSLTINQAMAPFVDVNSDGKYDPLSGDYPLMKGDQMLWWIINDNGPSTRSVSQTNALGIDVAITAYAYHKGTVIDNVIFYEYQIKNHSAMSYTNFRMGVNTDVDLGDPYDDYVGFDSTRRMGIVYNSKTPDSKYGYFPPAAGISVVELPGDAVNAYAPAGTFNTYINSTGSNGDPQNGLEFYRLLHSQSRIGTPFTNGSAYALSSENFMCGQGLTAGDQRFVIAGNDFTLGAGSSKKIAMALVVADSAGGCPNMNFAKLNETSDSAYKYYWNPPAISQPSKVGGVSASSALRLYPNPATHTLYLDVAHSGTSVIQIYDALGKLVYPPIMSSGKGFMIDVERLPAGVYNLRYSDEGRTETALFIKN